MFFLSLTPLILLGIHANLGLAGQVPVINGILGGTDFGDPISANVLAAAAGSSQAITPGQLRVVENSGVCETTSGVYQASGYGDLAADQSIWFWFFAARKNPDTAPLALWFNGGPGSSSMIGLFQEHGPCRINNDSSTVSLNPYSWNNEANMLYIDQPVGTGFSYGNTSHVGSSQSAAEDVWRFLQIFLADSRFQKYQKNDLALWTESYGGHYGPTFASLFLDKNQAIAAGTLQGVTLNLKVLGIGNGITDPLVQYPGYLTYARSNPYHPLVNATVLNAANTEMTSCLGLIQNCYNGGSNSTCFSAQSYCNQYILNPLAGPYDVYYVPTPDPDPYPPDFTTYIRGIASTIGGNATWAFSSAKVYALFALTGDWMRNSRPDLEKVINAGVRTVLYNGDADYICNYIGFEAMIDALQTNVSANYQSQAWQTYTVAGQTAGQYKNSGTFSYVRFYGAGHEVPAYTTGTLATGQAAAQMFTQIMSGQSLSATDANGAVVTKNASTTSGQSGARSLRVAESTVYGVAAVFGVVATLVAGGAW